MAKPTKDLIHKTGNNFSVWAVSTPVPGH